MTNLSFILSLIICCVVLFTNVNCNEDSEDVGEVTLENRVKGGEVVERGDIPYIVSIRAYDRHVCGGSILNSTFILTAAHCVHGYEDKPELFSIQYGTTMISARYPNVINASKIIKHDEYLLNDQNPNDIALIQLKRPMRFDADASPVKLPNKFNIPKDESDAVLAGWGLNETGGHIQLLLHKVTIKIFTDEECGKDKNYDEEIHICAGIPEGGKGQCTGDSGGPLVVDGVQYGIVSWSVKPCASKGHPGYFTNVPYYRDWIWQHSEI